MSGAVTAFLELPADAPSVRGFLHHPAVASRGMLVLAHGAGSDCRAAILVAVATAFAAAGFAVLRCELPFRQKRPHGPPRPGDAAGDREGLRQAVLAARQLAPRVFLGGHSYGGRQGSMLAASDPALVDGLLLLSYPLHPPRRPEQLRTAHFPKLQVRSLFVHGSRDPFGSLEEMRNALSLIPAPALLVPVEGAGHDLTRASVDVAALTVEAFETFFSRPH